MKFKELLKKMQESEKKMITISESEFVEKGTGVIKQVVSDITKDEKDFEEKMFLTMIGSVILGEIGRELFKDVEPTPKDGKSKL